MARIQVYQSTAPVPVANSGASRAAAAAGEAQGQLIEKVGETGQGIGAALQDRQNREQITDVMAGLATVGADLHNQWEEKLRTADPNDPNYKNLASDFMRDVAEPALAGVGEKATTNEASEAFRRASAGVKAELFQKATTDQTGMAGVNAAYQLSTLGEQLSASAFRDPTMFDTSLRLYDLSLAGAVHGAGLSEKDALELKNRFGKQLTQSIFAGMAASGNPAIAGAIDDPKYDAYLSREDRQKYVNEANAQARVAKDWQDKQDKDAYNAVVSQATAGLIQPDGSIRITPDYLKTLKLASLMPGAKIDPATQKSAIDFGLALQKEQNEGTLVPSDPATYEAFGQRLLLPSTDARALTARDVYQARLTGHLSTKDATYFISALDNLSKDPAKQLALKQFNQMLDGMKPMIAKSAMFGNILNSDEAQSWYAYQHDMQEIFERTYTNNGDWQALLDPRSKSFLGQYAPKYALDRKAAMDAIQRTIQSGPAVVAPPAKPGPATPAWKPGESGADYLKRMHQGGQ